VRRVTKGHHSAEDLVQRAVPADRDDSVDVGTPSSYEGCRIATAGGLGQLDIVVSREFGAESIGSGRSSALPCDRVGDQKV
jgi:hypothetical protein